MTPEKILAYIDRFIECETKHIQDAQKNPIDAILDYDGYMNSGLDNNESLGLKDRQYLGKVQEGVTSTDPERTAFNNGRAYLLGSIKYLRSQYLSGEEEKEYEDYKKEHPPQDTSR